MGRRVTRLGVAKRLGSPSASGSLKSRGIESIYLLVLFLLAAGVINASGNAGQLGIAGAIIVPSSNAQNVTETFIILFTYIVGSLGAYAMYLSGRQTIRARSAEIFFIGGLMLISIAMTVGYFVLSQK